MSKPEIFAELESLQETVDTHVLVINQFMNKFMDSLDNHFPIPESDRALISIPPSQTPSQHPFLHSQPHYLPKPEPYHFPSLSPPIYFTDLQKSHSKRVILEESPSELHKSPFNLQESHSLPTHISNPNPTRSPSVKNEESKSSQGTFTVISPIQILPKSSPPIYFIDSHGSLPYLTQTSLSKLKTVDEEPGSPPKSELNSIPKSPHPTPFTVPQQGSSLFTNLHRSLSSVKQMSIVPPCSVPTKIANPDYAIFQHTPPMFPPHIPAAATMAEKHLRETPLLPKSPLLIKRLRPIEIDEKRERRICCSDEQNWSLFRQILVMDFSSEGQRVMLCGEPPPVISLISSRYLKEITVSVHSHQILIALSRRADETMRQAPARNTDNLTYPRGL